MEALIATAVLFVVLVALQVIFSDFISKARGYLNHLSDRQRLYTAADTLLTTSRRTNPAGISIDSSVIAFQPILGIKNDGTKSWSTGLEVFWFDSEERSLKLRKLTDSDLGKLGISLNEKAPTSLDADQLSKLRNHSPGRDLCTHLGGFNIVTNSAGPIVTMSVMSENKKIFQTKVVLEPGA